ncbi:MAG: ATP-binding cassette domain-containing protein, partial [Candidatus Puniceispirillaceae bacterium]
MPEASRTEPKIRCHGLWKVFGDAAEAACARRGNGTSVDKAIAGTGAIIGASDVNLEIAPGELFVIMGLSGSGKSTVLRCIAQLQRPSAGEVWLDDANLATMPEARLMDIRRHRMGMVFQNFGLIPHFTALQNIAFPLKVRGESA